MLGIGEADSPIGKKFNEVFHMGTGLDDIKDIREFIYTYILPEPEVNIEFLQKDMLELERLQEILQEASDREELLKEINERIKSAKELLGKVKINESLVAYANLQENIEETNEKKYLIEEWNKSLEMLDKRLLELSESENKASALLYEAQRAAEENVENKEMLSLESENKNNKLENEKLILEAGIFEDVLQKLFFLIDRLNKTGFYVKVDDSIKDENAETDDRIREIKNSAKVFADIEEEIKNRDAKIRNDIAELNSKSDVLSKKIKSLEAGVMCYPDEAIFVRDKINAFLSEQSKRADAKLLCELLYMTDKGWQDAVESYLNTQRFNIIVEPENYLAAKKVFVSLGDKVKGIGLIDTRKIKEPEYKSLNESYLGDKIDSENIYAKSYARYVLKNVICCESSDDLENFSKSVTRDRLRFQNFCLQRMAKKEHFIGVDAIAKQLKSAKEEFIGVKKELTKLEEEKKNFDSIYNGYTKFRAGDNFGKLENYCESKSKSKALSAKIEDIAKKIEEFKKNPILLAMYDRVKECKKNLNAVRDEITDNKAKKQNLNSDINGEKNLLEELEANLSNLQAIYEKSVEEYPEFINDVEKKYQNERKSKKASVIAYNFSNRVIQDNIAFNNYLNQELIPLQQRYMATYTCDYATGLGGANRYMQEFLTLQNIELERHKSELVNAQIRCKDRFRKEVLFRMKDDILRARQQFKQINRVMENLEYGEESYRFGIDKSKDRELGMFYDIIMDKDNMQIDRDNEMLMLIAESNKSEIFESQIDDFMQRIMIDVEEHARQNLSGQKSGAKSMGMYVDYRTYLDYDIIVKNSVTGNEVGLSKVNAEGSGGENQAPFYVAICASLLQIYEQSKEGSIRLILLDEAFNNMTSDRIEPMMNMFKKLNLQLVLIATAEKATAILPYCDITYSIVKSGNRNAIGVFERIEDGLH